MANYHLLGAVVGDDTVGVDPAFGRGDAPASGRDPAFGAASDPALVMRVRNLAEVVKQQGGAAAAAAMEIAPATVTAKVYETIQQQLLVEFKKKGVDADVRAVDLGPSGNPLSKRDVGAGMVAGAAAVGVGYVLYRLIRHFVG